MVTDGFILHCGASLVEAGEVRTVITPDRTESHVPIGHWDLREQAISALADHGYQVVDEGHALSKNGGNWFCLMQVERHALDELAGMKRIVGLRNSHIKAYSATLSIGQRVVLCDNLLISANVVLGRKHTQNIWRDIPPLMSLAISRMDAVQTIEQHRFDAYQKTRIGRVTADNLVCSAIRNGALPPSKVGQVLEDYDHPEKRHPEMEGMEETLWRLYMAVTEHTKGSVWQAPKRCEKLHGLMDRIANFSMSIPRLSDIDVDAEEVEEVD